jgi:hypothetical protein
MISSTDFEKSRLIQIVFGKKTHGLTIGGMLLCLVVFSEIQTWVMPEKSLQRAVVLNVYNLPIA